MKYELQYLDANLFRTSLLEKLLDTVPRDASEAYSVLTTGMGEIAQELLPTQEIRAKKLWINGETLNLIMQRNNASIAGDLAKTAIFQKLIRSSAQRDCSRWFDELAASSSWADLRNCGKALRKIKVVCGT